MNVIINKSTATWFSNYIYKFLTYLYINYWQLINIQKCMSDNIFSFVYGLLCTFADGFPCMHGFVVHYTLAQRKVGFSPFIVKGFDTAVWTSNFKVRLTHILMHVNVRWSFPLLNLYAFISTNECWLWSYPCC